MVDSQKKSDEQHRDEKRFEFKGKKIPWGRSSKKPIFERNPLFVIVLSAILIKVIPLLITINRSLSTFTLIFIGIDLVFTRVAAKALYKNADYIGLRGVVRKNIRVRNNITAFLFLCAGITIAFLSVIISMANSDKFGDLGIIEYISIFIWMTSAILLTISALIYYYIKWKNRKMMIERKRKI